jgi:hypothetical protein
MPFAEIDSTIPISDGCSKMFALSASLADNHPTKTFCGIWGPPAVSARDIRHDTDLKGFTPGNSSAR